MALSSLAPLTHIAAASDSTDPFESISNFFDSGAFGVIAFMLKVFVFLLWAALVWWTYQDAKRRIEAPPYIAAAVALSVILPFLGTIIYLVVRPPEYLLETRERELELIALEQRLGAMGDEEGQRIVGRILGREPGAVGDASTQAALRKAGVATKDDLNDLDIRLTELEYRLRRAGAPSTGSSARPADRGRPSGPEVSRRGETATDDGDPGRTVIRRMRRTVRPDPEASVE